MESLETIEYEKVETSPPITCDVFRVAPASHYSLTPNRPIQLVDVGITFYSDVTSVEFFADSLALDLVILKVVVVENRLHLVVMSRESHVRLLDAGHIFASVRMCKVAVQPTNCRFVEKGARGKVRYGNPVNTKEVTDDKEI